MKKNLPKNKPRKNPLINYLSTVPHVVCGVRVQDVSVKLSVYLQDRKEESEGKEEIGEWRG